MPHYSDYHRTVIGYHGTKLSIARAIVLGERPFRASQNDDDWLGHGIYFWEYAPQQAFLWARDRQASKKWAEEIAVLGSMIRLGNCFDLLDPENVRDLSRLYRFYEQTMERSGAKIAANVRSRKRLNCSVFEFGYAALADEGQSMDTCRAVFLPAKDSKRRNHDDTMLWAGCGINPRAHVQICVRNPNCILGTWLVKPSEV